MEIIDDDFAETQKKRNVQHPLCSVQCDDFGVFRAQSALVI